MKTLITFLALASLAFGQYTNSASGSTNAAGEINSKPAIQSSTSAPSGACTAGKDFWLQTAAPFYPTLYVCSATNVWSSLQYPNVMQYGCKGDGIVDDTTCLTNALAALPARGGRLQFPCGDFYITTGLTTGTKASFFIEGAGSGGWGGNINQCTRIITDQAITMLSLGNGANQLVGGLVQGISFIDKSNAGAGQTVPIGLYISDSFTEVRNCVFEGMVIGVKYDGGAFFQNGNSFHNNTLRLNLTPILVSGLSDGPILGHNYIATSSAVPNAIGLDINSSGTGTAVKSFGDNFVISSASVSSGAIATATRSGTATVTVTTSGALPGTFLNHGHGTITGCNIADYNVGPVLITVTGANTFTYTAAAVGGPDSATGCNPVPSFFQAGIRTNSTDNFFDGTKIEMQPSCCVGTGIILSNGSNRNVFNGSITKTVDPILFEASAGSLQGTVQASNNTNVPPTDLGSSGSWLLNVIGAGAANGYLTMFPGPRIYGGTGAPGAGVCTAATLGSLYLRSSGNLYVCVSAGTWTAVTVP